MPLAKLGPAVLRSVKFIVLEENRGTRHVNDVDVERQSPIIPIFVVDAASWPPFLGDGEIDSGASIALISSEDGGR
jgi:hypothetical protein